MYMAMYIQDLSEMRISIYIYKYNLTVLKCKKKSVFTDFDVL